MTPLRAVGIGGAVLAVLVAGSIAAFAPRHDRARAAVFRGTPVEPPKVATDFTLTGAAGRPARVVDPAYAVTFLFFGYTHCPDECPLAMAALGRAYRSLTPAAASRTRVVFVTVDPKRDTPAVVTRYVRNFGGRFVGLTGSTRTLAPVWRAYDITVDATTREIGHGGDVYAIDRTGRIVLVYPPTVAAGDLASDGAALADGR